MATSGWKSFRPLNISHQLLLKPNANVTKFELQYSSSKLLTLTYLSLVCLDRVKFIQEDGRWMAHQDS